MHCDTSLTLTPCRLLRGGGGVVLLWLRNGLHVRGRLLAAFQRSHVHEADNTPERVADGEPHAPADRVRRVDAYAIAQANCSADSAAIGPSEPKLSRPGLSRTIPDYL